MFGKSSIDEYEKPEMLSARRLMGPGSRRPDQWSVKQRGWHLGQKKKKNKSYKLQAASDKRQAHPRAGVG